MKPRPLQAPVAVLVRMDPDLLALIDKLIAEEFGADSEKRNFWINRELATRARYYQKNPPQPAEKNEPEGKTVVWRPGSSQGQFA